MSAYAYARIGDTDEHDLEFVNEKLGELYPGKAFDLIYDAGLPSEVVSLIASNGYSVEAVDGDSYEKCQWIKVSDDFEINEPEGDDDASWNAYEKVVGQVSDLRQRYANALAQEIAAHL